jgi:thiamine-phosphate pyrophosphorylase
MTPGLDLRLIVITDAGLSAPRTIDATVLAALEAGAPAIQLRDKKATPAELYQEAIVLGDLTRRFGALLFVNDRLDVALAANADGVHLGPHDLPLAAARKAVRLVDRDDFVIGASTDDPETARQLVRRGADYIGCGAVFGTTSKAGLEDERIGTDGLARVVRSVDAPVVGIGGIRPENVRDVARTGAAGVAVVSAVMTAEDVDRAVRALLAAFG